MKKINNIKVVESIIGKGRKLTKKEQDKFSSKKRVVDTVKNEIDKKIYNLYQKIFECDNEWGFELDYEHFKKEILEFFNINKNEI